MTPKTQGTSSRVNTKEFTLVSQQFNEKIAGLSIFHEKQLLYASKRNMKVYVKDLVTSGQRPVIATYDISK
jgi:hypothetical protein